VQAARFVLSLKNDIFVITKAKIMKKLVLFVVIAGFISACSQYTCPTYSKKEAPKKAAAEKRI
jgi:hypothetical protein